MMAPKHQAALYQLCKGIYNFPIAMTDSNNDIHVVIVHIVVHEIFDDPSMVMWQYAFY